MSDKEMVFKGRERSPGPGYVWISICSLHRQYDESCHLCRRGYWESRRWLFWENLLFKASPWLWRKWANWRRKE